MAYSFNKGLVMIRKNKLPGNKISFEYDLEYGAKYIGGKCKFKK